MATNTTFQQYLQSAYTSGPWSTEEVIEFVLPLFEEVLSFHENNQVGSFEKSDTVFLTDGRLDIDENFTHDPLLNLKELQKILDHQQITGYSIKERILVDEDVSENTSKVVNLEVQNKPDEPLTHPVYMRGYQCYELKIGHHDAQTDIFCLGLILGSVVMGLDLYDADDLNQFASFRSQPAGLNHRTHPTINSLVTEMTELDRRNRSRDLGEIVQRLKNYRDYDPTLLTDLSKLAIREAPKPADRRSFVIAKLRNRLFDTSRRNRLLYYKANSRFVNLTVSSVPMVLHYQSINPQSLFTWNTEISKKIIAQNDILLNKYLRFEDHAYLGSQLNSIRQQSENDKKEYGFSQLKLAVAFLHWHNLKGDINERIQSPLLLLPVELERKKSLKEEKFTLRIIDNAAVINPVLANYLKDLYGIDLPESIDFDDVTMEDFFEDLQAKILSAKQGVKLNYIDKPRIKIVYSVARQTINQYKKRLKLKGTPAFHHIDYSYAEDNYKPLGLELFKQKIQPRSTSLEFLLNEHPATRQPSQFADTTEKVKGTFALTDGENNPYSWDFDVCTVVLGNFNYKKMSLVRDYNKVGEEGIEHKVFEELFSNEPKKPQPEKLSNDPGEWYHVITADPTQATAVLQSRTGRSYIIQGPPGTGKSQTITNLIADFLANDKRVLFVCEKRAALDVVYHRLQQNRLAELCCYIHDSQEDKKEFIRDLKTVYDDFINNKMDADAIGFQRKLVLDKLLEKVELLRLYHSQQCLVNPEAGVTTRELLEKLVQLRPSIARANPEETTAVPHYHNWVQYGAVIDTLGKSLEESGAESTFATHSFNNLGKPLVKSDNPFSLMNSIAGHCENSIRQISEIISGHQIPAQHATRLEHIKNLVQDSVVLERLAESRNLRLVDQRNPEAGEFEQLYKQYTQVQDAYKQMLESNKRWASKFDKNEVQQAIDLAGKNEKSFFSFFNGSWRRLKKQLNQAYDFSAHQVRPAYSHVLKQLQQEYEAQENAEKARSDLQRRYNVDNIELVNTGIEVLRRKQGDKEIDFLLQHPESNELVLKLSKLNNALHQLEINLQQYLFEFNEKTLQEIKDDIATISSNAELLKDLLPVLRRFMDLPDEVQQFIRKIPLTPVQAEASMASRTLQSIFDRNMSFAAINGRILEDTVKDIEQSYQALLKLNSDYIRARRRQVFLKRYEISNASTTTLDPKQKELKKTYTDGRKVLEREMSKTMRYKSIRELASNESGVVLKDIKPVWLMSPLSVSDSLPLDTAFFDVVIFDEASQITLEEGIPALFRAPQTIIVGDDKQMPPSNFFNARAADPEDLEIVDGENEEEILSAEADSLLVQGSRKLHSTMLSWHYRSRYETLISYSNHAFYEAGLLTIPDKKIHRTDKPLLEVKQAEEAELNAGLVLTESMSFHYLPNSIYEARSNIGEAKYIAQLVRKLLLDNVQETIGIVAFSQEQQGVIEEAISAIAVEDKIFEETLEKAYNRRDEGQFTGLFVKNLENVQGDERDIIIMSVCYGHDANKKMLMNFGPINRKGGEKRLNVIFSRAKKHMAVVSSIRYHHITNDYNDGASYFKRFLQYAEMVSTGNMGVARSILDGLIATEKKEAVPATHLRVTSRQIKKALEQKGYTVDEEVGQSSFKCTLGIKKKADDLYYSLGVMVDDDYHYINPDLVEQYYQRPSILRAFGWETVNVYAKDWLEDASLILQSLINKLEGKDDVEVKQSMLPEIKTDDEPAYDITLETADGHLFWEIKQLGAQLQVRFGKKGAKGQVQIKTMANEAEAAAMKRTMAEEQVSKGYRYITDRE